MHGTRGWTLDIEDQEEKKIIMRELIRLELSIKSGIDKFKEDKEIIVCMHYPPSNKELRQDSEFIKLMKKYNVKKCLYGHLHGEAIKQDVIKENICGIELELVSSDYLDFKLKKIL